MAFANSKKLKLIAALVGDEMNYIKGAKSQFPQSELKGKKYGMKVTGYLADPGTVHDGIVANPDSVNEPEINAYMNNKNSSVELDLWDEFVNTEDGEKFMEEIGAPRAKNLAISTQKAVMDEAMFTSAQALVVTAADFKLLTKSAKALNELGVAGKKLSFQSPTIMGDIAEGGLAKFIPNEKMVKIYEDAYLGKYGGAEQIEIANVPVIDTTGMDSAPTISGEIVKDANNNVLGVTAISGITLSNSSYVVAGMPYKLSGLKVRLPVRVRATTTPTPASLLQPSARPPSARPSRSPSPRCSPPPSSTSWARFAPSPASPSTSTASTACRVPKSRTWAPMATSRSRSWSSATARTA